MQWADSDGGLCIVQHPFWSNVAARAPGSTLLYDCMDYHARFQNNSPDVLAAEASLTRDTDMLAVTSALLVQALGKPQPPHTTTRHSPIFDQQTQPPPTRHPN